MNPENIIGSRNIIASNRSHHINALQMCEAENRCPHPKKKSVPETTLLNVFNNRTHHIVVSGTPYIYGRTMLSMILQAIIHLEK